MTDRDSTTRTRARAPGEEDYPPSTAVHWRVTDPTLSGIFVDTNAMHEGRKQTNTGPGHAGSRLKLTDALGRRRPKCHPSSRTGENPPYGMIGGIEETSASFEARSAPRSYPTSGGCCLCRGSDPVAGDPPVPWVRGYRADRGLVRDRDGARWLHRRCRGSSRQQCGRSDDRPRRGTVLGSGG